VFIAVTENAVFIAVTDACSRFLRQIMRRVGSGWQGGKQEQADDNHGDNADADNQSGVSHDDVASLAVAQRPVLVCV
jgi:hypothetical protein